jgi:hypothetical protein
MTTTRIQVRTRNAPERTVEVKSRTEPVAQVKAKVVPRPSASETIEIIYQLDDGYF